MPRMGSTLGSLSPFCHRPSPPTFPPSPFPPGRFNQHGLLNIQALLLSPPPSPQVGFGQNELQNSAFSFFKEANKVLGLDVPKLMLKNDIELQYVGETAGRSRRSKTVCGGDGGGEGE